MWVDTTILKVGGRLFKLYLNGKKNLIIVLENISLTGCESNPSCIRNHIPIPVAWSEENDSSGDADATNKYANQGQEPLRLQFRGETHLGPVVQGHAWPHETKSRVTCK